MKKDINKVVGAFVKAIKGDASYVKYIKQ